MTTASIAWQAGQETIDANIAATIAMDGAAWEGAGARFTAVDDGDGEHPRLSAGTVEIDGRPVEFGVLDYAASTTYLLVGGAEADRPDIAAKVLDELLAAGALPSADVVLEVLGLNDDHLAVAAADGMPAAGSKATSRRHVADASVPPKKRSRRSKGPIGKAELIDAIAKDSGLSKSDSSRALESLLTTVTKTLKKGDEVAITGFGKFSVAKRGARTGRHPQTGEPVKIKASKNAKFTAGATLKNTVVGRREK